MSSDYVYEQVPYMGMKEELVAWELLVLLNSEESKGFSNGDYVREALNRVSEMCNNGKMQKRVLEHYIDNGGWILKD